MVLCSVYFSVLIFLTNLWEKLLSKLLTTQKAQIHEMVYFSGMSECLVHCT